MTKYWKYIFIIYSGVVFLLNILPINGSSSPLNHVFIIHLRLDYWVHAVLFLPWMGFAFRGYDRFNASSHKPALKVILLFFTGILFALFCESIQYFTPWRTFNINDLIANLLGIMIGLPLILFVRQRSLENRKS